MKKKQIYLALLVSMFLLVFAFRLYFAFQTEHFSLEDAYFNYRQVDSIKSGLLPSYADDLSYSGRTHIFPPVFYYLLSAFSFFIGTTLALKVIPNLLAATLVIIVYYIVLQITNNRPVALFSAFSSAFIPVFFAQTVNSASIFCFVLPLIFYLLYCFMRIKEKRYLYHFLFFSFVLSLTSAISFLFIFALLIYITLTKLEYKVQSKVELEVVLFVTFLTLWINILIYKDAFLFHSYNVIWQNIPVQVLADYFKDVDIVLSVTGVGLIPLLLGIYSVYRYMFKERNKQTYLLIAFALSVAFLLWFKLITLDIGLMFLGVLLVPLASQTLDAFFRYIEKTKISSYHYLFWIGLVVLFLLSSVAPSVGEAYKEIKDSVSPDEVDALLWLERNTDDDAVVLATVKEGDLVAAIAQRRNVADSDFMLIRNSGDIFEDILGIYTAVFKTDAVETLGKYGVDYIYFSPRAKDLFSISKLKFAEEDCFDLVYDDEVMIYRSKCRIKV
jgi:hypothetical protein